jgi:hypothetical protein
MLVVPFLPVLLASLSAASPISLQQVFQAPADGLAAPHAPTDLVDAIVADAARAGADIHAMGMKLGADGRAAASAPLIEAARVVHGADGPAPGGWVWKSCGDDGDAVEVTSIQVSPDPPKPGQNLTVVASGIVKKEIKVRVKSGALSCLVAHMWRAQQVALCMEASCAAQWSLSLMQGCESTSAMPCR